MCAVSITGDRMSGKSYFLSEAFKQPDVFPVGNGLDIETIGIWLWIVPEKYWVCLSNWLCFFVTFPFQYLFLYSYLLLLRMSVVNS